MALRLFAMSLLILTLGCSRPDHPELEGVDYSGVSKSGDSVTIDGETFAVVAPPKKEVDGQYGLLAQLGRGLAMRNPSDKLVSCSQLWVYEADYGFNPEILGAACTITHEGENINVTLCHSVFSDGGVPYRIAVAPTRRDIVAFATSSLCGGRHYEITQLNGTSQISDGDGEPFEIQELTSEGAKRTFPRAEICETGVRIPVGVAHGNVFSGAICRVTRDGRSVRLAICSDESVGHYKEREIGNRSMTKDDLAIFTMTYCSAG